MDESNMTIEHLSKWFLNFSKRLETAEELGCKGSPRFTDWTCCTVHRNFLIEDLLMARVAKLLYLDPRDNSTLPDCDIFCEMWWRAIGQDAVADQIAQSYLKKPDR